MNPTQMIYARLMSDMGFRASLASYQSAPAIFSDRAPDAFQFEDFQGPAIVIAAATDDEAEETFTERQRAIRQDIGLYAYSSGSTVALDAAARAVRAMFHNQEPNLPIVGGKVIVCAVAGPVAAPTTDANVIGRRLTLRLQIQEIDP